MTLPLPLEGGGPLKLLAGYLGSEQATQNRKKKKRICIYSLITSSWMSDHIAFSQDILIHPCSGAEKTLAFLLAGWAAPGCLPQCSL